MLVLSEADLTGLLPPLQIVEAVEAALRAQVANRVIVPKRMHLDWNGNTLLTMPAIAEHSFGIKLVSVVPGNAARALPVTNGLMIVNDIDNGLTTAVMNAAALTAQRTGAVGALGAKYLTPSETSSVGVIGCGVQGTWQAIFACAVRPIVEVFCFSRSAQRRERFIATVQSHVPDVRVTSCRDARDLLARTDFIIAATSSEQPVLPDEAELLRNKHFVSVGSFKPTMQELPDNVYRLSGTLAVDSEHAAHEVGDLINSLDTGVLQAKDIYSIAECVTGQRRTDTSRTTAYKTVGAAMYDLYVASALYAAAKTRGVGQDVAL